MSTKIGLVFPHQLIEDNPLIPTCETIYLIEEFLFFKQYPFHKQKIALHRASMKFYADFLIDKGVQVNYIEANAPTAKIQELIAELGKNKSTEIHYIDPTDFWVEKRLKEAARKAEITLTRYESPLFINSRTDLKSFFKPDKKKFFQTSFYKSERVRLDILMDENEKPKGGEWTYDKENRKKYPKGKNPPPIHYPNKNDYYTEAVNYIKSNFSDHYGELSASPLYPTSFKAAKKWMHTFFEQRFHEFGPYEDAIVAESSILNHSVLTPMLNIGLLLPGEIIDEALTFAAENNVPINSVEGFVRQIIGWREFMRGMYEAKNVEQRTKNYWGFTRKIPASFYTGTTGIPPIDVTIKKILKDGYCHHIERLMVLGNFMVLCEFDPDDVYQWFMELFIDAYDWVMVPNVYGMSQFADGGLLATKPYISGSNYLMKMSNYKKGDWQQIWDGLFWRFMHVHRDFFEGNPRLGMLVRNLDKMGADKRDNHIKNAEDFLKTLD